MKKFLLLFIGVAVLSGCSDQIQFNAPALQANKNYKLWRATYFDGRLSDQNVLIINAGNALEKMTLVIPSLKIGTYHLTRQSNSKIEFTAADSKMYSTSHALDLKEGTIEDLGTITITEVDGNTVTGNFHCMLFSEDGKVSVGLNQGIFYQVPIRPMDLAFGSLF